MATLNSLIIVDLKMSQQYLLHELNDFAARIILQVFHRCQCIHFLELNDEFRIRSE